MERYKGDPIKDPYWQTPEGIAESAQKMLQEIVRARQEKEGLWNMLDRKYNRDRSPFEYAVRHGMKTVIGTQYEDEEVQREKANRVQHTINTIGYSDNALIIAAVLAEFSIKPSHILKPAEAFLDELQNSIFLTELRSATAESMEEIILHSLTDRDIDDFALLQTPEGRVDFYVARSEEIIENPQFTADAIYRVRFNTNDAYNKGESFYSTGVAKGLEHIISTYK